eukprot:jgi/Picsp_1/6607/NSC_03950-R1_conserved hypothetical
MIHTSIRSGWLIGLSLLVFTLFIPLTNISHKGSTNIKKQTVLLALERRDGIGSLLELNGFTSGAELGVQRGIFAETTLGAWPSCRKYILVDIWRSQENYKDVANVANDEQEKIYQEAMNRLKPFKELIDVKRMTTVEASKTVPDESLDYIYVDARHDYCGAFEDMSAWWPKLKPGGILAGHDYHYAKEVSGQDWSVCANGTKNPGAVRGAVEDFAKEHGLALSVTFREAMWNSWMAVKPSC